MKKVVILRQDHYDNIMAALNDMKIDVDRIEHTYIRGKISGYVEYIQTILESED